MQRLKEYKCNHVKEIITMENNNRRELTAEELEQVNGAGFWDVLKEIGEWILDGMTGAD